VTERKIRVLFVCGHNSARSQIAEVFLGQIGGAAFQVESAGLELADRINPLVVEVMKEVGFDLSGKSMQRVFDLFQEGRLFDYVITVCDAAKAGKCPIFPGICTRLHWPFEDPASLEGSREERLQTTRRIRDEIRRKIEEWVDELVQEGVLDGNPELDAVRDIGPEK
jgi:arsenate reductase